MGVGDWIIVLGAAIAAVAVFEFVSGAGTKWRLDRALEKARNKPPDPAERDRLHGTLVIQGHTLHYTRSGSPLWSVDLDAVRLIGERTTGSGPFLDDWFLVLFSATAAEVHEAPVYANPDVHEELSQALGTEMRPQLVNSTELRTAIAWPQHLEGQPFFSYTPAPRGSGFFDRLKDRISPLVEPRLTETALRHIRGEGVGAA